jgi:hypothetical protein
VTGAAAAAAALGLCLQQLAAPEVAASPARVRQMRSMPRHLSQSKPCMLHRRRESDMQKTQALFVKHPK